MNFYLNKKDRLSKKGRFITKNTFHIFIVLTLNVITNPYHKSVSLHSTIHFKFSTMISYGYSDVGDIVMLVTLWWWPIWDVGDRIIMLVIFSLCWCFSNVLNRSPTSWIGHQHLKLVTNSIGLQHPSPTSM